MITNQIYLVENEKKKVIVDPTKPNHIVQERMQK